MQIPASFFGSISPAQFLAEYWQKKPLLVRGAWPGFEPPFTVDEFKQLSMREDALSRLIIRIGTRDWELLDGPFIEEDFDDLPNSKWTLLIQEMDRMVEDVHRMLQVVGFLPNWRLDDIMVSYATPDGGVGAHIDNYDVFLLQGLGRRRWQIDTTPVEDELLLEDVDVSILADFQPDQDWILEPGDMLYLPPRIAHHGEAVDPCMTFSIGCRAPSAQELVSGLLEMTVQELDPNDRYVDPDLDAAGPEGSEAGRLGGEVTAYARAQLNNLLGDEDRLRESIGCLLSEPRRYVGDPEVGSMGDGSVGEPLLDGGSLGGAARRAAAGRKLRRMLKAGSALRPISASQGLYDVTSDGDVLLFLSGEGFRLDGRLSHAVAALTSNDGYTLNAAGADEVRSADGADPDPDSESDWMDFLAGLLEQGYLKLVRSA